MNMKFVAFSHSKDLYNHSVNTATKQHKNNMKDKINSILYAG